MDFSVGGLKIHFLFSTDCSNYYKKFMHFAHTHTLQLIFWITILFLLERDKKIREPVEQIVVPHLLSDEAVSEKGVPVTEMENYK